MIYEFKLRRVRRSKASEAAKHVTDPVNAAAIIRPFIKHEARECFFVLCLDSRNALLGVDTVAIGGLAQVEVHPREAFRAAILSSASAIIIAHNHPSGDPKPSENDYALTARFMRAGTLLGIPVLDHVIVTETGHFSFAENGMTAETAEYQDSGGAMFIITTAERP